MNLPQKNYIPGTRYNGISRCIRYARFIYSDTQSTLPCRPKEQPTLANTFIMIWTRVRMCMCACITKICDPYRVR